LPRFIGAGRESREWVGRDLWIPSQGSGEVASLDLVEKRAGKPLGQMAFDIPCREQLDHARAIGFGNPDYCLVEIASGT